MSNTRTDINGSTAATLGQKLTPQSGGKPGKGKGGGFWDVLH